MPFPERVGTLTVVALAPKPNSAIPAYVTISQDHDLRGTPAQLKRSDF